jgi:hypothetical protein
MFFMTSKQPMCPSGQLWDLKFSRTRTFRYECGYFRWTDVQIEVTIQIHANNMPLAMALIMNAYIRRRLALFCEDSQSRIAERLIVT